MSTAPTVWIYTDVFPPAVAGAAYMVETWTRQLTEQGFRVRVFHPSGTRDRWRTSDQVAFKTWKDVAYVGDLHARFSALAEVRRAKDELPDLIFVATPGRVGMLGMATAQRYGVPLVLVYSDGPRRRAGVLRLEAAVFATMSKVFAMGAASRKLRRRMLDVRSFLRDHDQPITQRAPFHLLRACQVGATSVILLSRKRVDMVQGWAPEVPVHVIPSGIDRLPRRRGTAGADVAGRRPARRLRRPLRAREEPAAGDRGAEDRARRGRGGRPHARRRGRAGRGAAAARARARGRPTGSA